MRERKIIIIGLSVFAFLCLTLFGVSVYIRNMHNEFKESYKSAADVYKEQIEQIGSKKEIETILKDSLSEWNKRDKEMFAKHLEEMQFYIDEYMDIQNMPKERVDATYRKAINELVRKYKNDELRPTE